MTNFTAREQDAIRAAANQITDEVFLRSNATATTRDAVYEIIEAVTTKIMDHHFLKGKR